MSGRVQNNPSKRVIGNFTPSKLWDKDRPVMENIILGTLRICSEIVGCTLGPGGKVVLLQRGEPGLSPLLTKDGVTVFRHLGFEDPAADQVMETARDASIRTANEAGDGTTTATILADSFVDRTYTFCRKYPRISPQAVVRLLMNKIFPQILEPAVCGEAVPAKLDDEQGRQMLRSVALVSANGDEPLADVVMECLDLVGENGNVTILERSGPSVYTAEKIPGYPVAMGYEESCGRFYGEYINDQGQQRCWLEKPTFLLFHGKVTDIKQILPVLERIGSFWEMKCEGQTDSPLVSPNVVLVATHFSESVLGQLATNFANPTSINVFPLVAPLTQQINAQQQLLLDLAAVTGATLFDPIAKPLDTFVLQDLGPGVEYFEAQRFRSNIIGVAQGPMLEGQYYVMQSGENERPSYDDILLRRVAAVRQQAAHSASIADQMLTNERLGKLTCGIAQLIVSGSSNGELKERRDRAEDAVCAVRGALKHGCLPGGAWMLLKLRRLLEQQFPAGDDFVSMVVHEVLRPALRTPAERLFSNIGIPQEEADGIIQNIEVSSCETGAFAVGDETFQAGDLVFDALHNQYVQAFEHGLLDSTPAVLEALRNSLSIACQLGTLGAMVVYPRDSALEMQDARDFQMFLRTVNHTPANERA